MPKAGAFDKAKVKKTGGGFGASKAGRFDGPKESCDDAPSSGMYNPHERGGLGAKRYQGRSTGGFGSSSKRDSAILGQRNDAPGPGAYADGLKVRSSFAGSKQFKASSFGSLPQHGTPAPIPSTATPGPGEYAAPTGVGSVQRNREKSNGFGFAKRFEDAAEVVQADYDVAGAFDDATSHLKKASRARDVGFGGRVARGSSILGQSNDAPGPGAYAYARPGAFAAKVTKSPSSAFASRSNQHASNPSDGNVGPGPPPGAYDLLTYDPLVKRSFHAEAVLGVKGPGGFGSTAVRQPKVKEGNETPGPGEYFAGQFKTEARNSKLPSSVFASTTNQRGANNLPAYNTDLVRALLAPMLPHRDLSTTFSPHSIPRLLVRAGFGVRARRCRNCQAKPRTQQGIWRRVAWPCSR